MSPSATCSKLLASILLAFPLAAGTVSGLVRVKPASGAMPRDLSGVVVWLEPVHAGPAPAPVHARILQKNKTFQPHVLAIPEGSTVDFPNLDPIFHNAFSNFNGQIFDIGLYPPGKSRSVVFRRPGVVRVFCNIHPAMSAVIVVVDTPWSAVTNASGRFRIANVPPGTYRRRIFYERATPETLNSLTAEIDASAPDTRLPDTSISEAGYIPLAHTDKHGQPYPRNATDPEYSIPQ